MSTPYLPATAGRRRTRAERGRVALVGLVVMLLCLAIGTGLGTAVGMLLTWLASVG